jgi:hypothetical protein
MCSTESAHLLALLRRVTAIPGHHIRIRVIVVVVVVVPFLRVIDLWWSCCIRRGMSGWE